MSENDTLRFGGFPPPSRRQHRQAREEVNVMDYKRLYEKHARSQRQRGWIAIAGGVINIAAGILMLKQLRDEKRK